MWTESIKNCNAGGLIVVDGILEEIEEQLL